AAVDGGPWEAGEQRSFLLSDFFTYPPVSPLRSLRFGLQKGCDAFLSQGDDEKLIGVEPASIGGTSVYLPHVSVATGFLELDYVDTRLAVVNTQLDVANVTAQLFGMDGVLRGNTSFSLPSLGSHSLLVSQEFASALPGNGAGGEQFEGYMRLVSDKPVA